jgi:PAS domain S-box-containing protein
MLERESGYRGIFEHAVIGIFRTTPSGLFLTVNPAFARFAGYENPSAMIAAINDIGRQLYVDPEERTRLTEQLARDGEVRNFEARYYHRDGHIVWCSLNARAVRDENGNILYYEGTVDDIDNRRAMEAALRKSGDTFRSLVEQLQDSVIILSPEGNVLFANPSAYRLVSAGPGQDMEGTSIYPFLEPDSQGHAREDIAVVMERGITTVSEFRLRTMDGRIRWIEASGRRISYQDGDAVLVTIRDVTEQREAREELAAMTRKLRLLSSVTRHDILNKITVILGFIQAAKKKSPEKDTLALLEKLEASTRAIREQVEFTRVYESLGSHAPQWQDLSAILRQLAGPAAIRVDDSVAGIEIYADPMLEKVLYNLFENSIRYGGDITAITLCCEECRGMPKIIFTDNGPGIPADEKDLIFERGYGRNTGLGLFLCREILSLTGIAITECGTPGQGARFEISVPPGGFRRRPGRAEE